MPKQDKYQAASHSYPQQRGISSPKTEATTIRLLDGWLPLTPGHLLALGWSEGQAVDIEIVDGALILSPHR